MDAAPYPTEPSDAVVQIVRGFVFGLDRFNGVVDRFKFTMSIPSPVSVEQTKSDTIWPDSLASRPMTTLSRWFGCCNFSHEPYAEANLTVSIGVRPSLIVPPIVPLIPEIDLISVILKIFVVQSF